ncbi:MAG: hypothetical protein IKV35_03085, partial [Clostridia bacterium]|nr:hypothetical protein [Clostridia bacterium]
QNGSIFQMADYLLSLQPSEKTPTAHKINVEEVTQSILRDMFAMIMMVEIDNSDIPFTVFAENLENIGKEMGLSIHAMHEDLFNAMHTI